MDSPGGQIRSEIADRGTSGDTGARLVGAATELIAEVGWGRVTTRAVAERARLPHGAVSYHFRGKQDLLTQAALATIDEMFPIAELEAIKGLAELVPLATAWMAHPAGAESVQVKVLMEAMCESGRSQALRQSIAAKLQGYRRVVTGLVRAAQDRGTVASAVSSSAVGTLVAAAGDGLLLHALLDSELDVAAPLETLLVLLGLEPGHR